MLKINETRQINENSNGSDITPNSDYLYIDGKFWRPVSRTHVRTGKGGGYYQVTLRSMDGITCIRRFRPKEKVALVKIEKKPIKYLYKSHSFYHFEGEFEVPESAFGELGVLLKSGDEVVGVFYNEELLEACLPHHISCIVDESGGKVAKSKGIRIVVPSYIKVGDVITISSEKNEFIERVS